jgi:hypothetical protein
VIEISDSVAHDDAFATTLREPQFIELPQG